MRPILLKIKGLNSFIEEQTIDFAKLMEPGLFGIFGPTGSGKTTILDGITLALYGEIARKSKNFVNTNCKSASVLYEFQISGASVKRYRVEREFKQDSNREGYKTGKCRLTDITEKEPVILADKVTDVNQCCIEIIGLKSDDFQRTVVLPQGRFSEFLKLEGKKRSEMLERLFCLQSYGDGLNRKLKEKSSELSLLHSNLDGQLKAYEELTEDKIKEKKLEVEQLSEQYDKLEKEYISCTKKFNEGKEIWNLQLELKRHEDAKQKLQEKEEEIQLFDTQIKLSQKAGKVYPYIQALEQTNEDLLRNELELTRVQKLRNNSEESKQRAEEEFLKWKLDRESLSPKIREKVQAYKEAIVCQKEYTESHRKNLEAMQKRSSLESQLQGVLQEEKNLKRVIEENLEKLDKLQENQKKYDIQAQVRQQIQSGITLEQKVNILQEKLLEKEQELEKNIVEQNKKKEQLTSIKEVLFTSTWEETCVIGEYQSALLLLKDKRRIYTEAISKNIKNKKKLDTYQSELAKVKTQKDILCVQLEQIKTQRNQWEVDLLSYELRQKLVDGRPCPVCGSIHHENVEMHQVDKKEFERITKKCDMLDEKIRELDKMEYGFASNQDRVKAEWQELQETIKTLKIDAEQMSEEEIDKKLNLLPEYQPLVVSLEILKNSEKQMNASLNEDRKVYCELSKELAELTESIPYPSFSIASEKLRMCDEMLDKIKDNMQKGLSITERKRSDLEVCQKRQNKILTEIAVLEETIKTTNLQSESLKKKFSTCFRDEQEISIEDTSLFVKKNQLEDQEKQIEKSYQKAEEEKEEEQKKFLLLHEQYLQVKSTFESAKTRKVKETEQVEQMLKKEEFSSVKECVEAILDKNVVLKKERLMEQYRTQCAEIKGIIRKIKEQLNGRMLKQEEWILLEQQMEEIGKKQEEWKLNLNNQKHIYERMQSDWEKLKEVLIQRKKIEHQESLMADLIQLFRGKRFVEYVAYSKLNYISKAASHRLKAISNGNYGLELDQAGKFMICDYKNGGSKRDAYTLSGGETFLVSLSLSLALSEQVQLKGTAPLELFFLDEGFGTLDDELLEVVMNSLERIQNKHLTVGIISHVESVKNRVPIKLLVSPSVSGMGGTKVRIEKN